MDEKMEEKNNQSEDVKIKEATGVKSIPFAVIAVGIIVFAYIFMRYIVQPPFPATLTNFFMMFILAGVLLHITLDEKKIEDIMLFFSFTKKEPMPWDIVRYSVVVIVPLLIASNVYSAYKVTYAPPAELFSPHVTPPEWVVNMKVPEYAVDPNKWESKYIEEGRLIYEDNCVPCHGKDADGKGPMASAITYPASPTNFKEAGTIAQLPITYVYWRVKDGGITDKQFKSAMPGWEEELSEDDMWRVIMYTYTKAGVKPRTWAE
ncbi:MAG: cytochrome c [Candidatus Magnetoovum sp. WYHC-5]|nr:cytochrome c [Candidatus Magnetoovum sp. WYHC-5]